jgi:ureidoglycolate dehydrogenase (NAD+)
MAQITSPSVSVPAEVLRNFVYQCLQKAAVPDAHAALVSESLVESNLRGIDSHGVARMPHYLNRIRHGSVNPTPDLRFERVAAALGRLDGDHGLGQVVMSRATDEVIALARETGAGWVAVENSSHCGALSYYGLRIASAGMLGIAFTHSDSFVVPYAGVKAFCGTNPVCLTAPEENGEHFCLDFATSIVPWNTVANAAIEGVELPDHWAVDAEGNSTQNARDARAVRPFGDFKGSGLGLMVEVFCSFLLGTPYGPNIAAMYGDPSRKRHLGGLVGAIDIRNFRDVAAFKKSLTQLGAEWNAQQRKDPNTPIFYPGQPERSTRSRRLADGVPIGLKVCELFEKTGRELGVEWPVKS